MFRPAAPGGDAALMPGRERERERDGGSVSRPPDCEFRWIFGINRYYIRNRHTVDVLLFLASFRFERNVEIFAVTRAAGYWIFREGWNGFRRLLRITWRMTRTAAPIWAVVCIYFVHIKSIITKNFLLQYKSWHGFWGGTYHLISIEKTILQIF